MRVNRKKRAQLAGALAATLVIMVVASGSDAWAAPLTGSEVRHASGIALLGPVDYPRLFAQWKMTERLDRSYNSARILAEQNRGAFGYPWLDSRAEEVVIRVANVRGEALARSWIQSGVTQTIDKPGGPVDLNLRAPEVGVRMENVDRTIEQLESVLNAMGPGLADVPGSNRIFQGGPDHEHNRIVYSTDRVSDAMLRALAARFGTEALAVRIERNPRFTSGPAPVETSSPVDPVVTAALAGSAALFVGVAFWLIARRRIRS